MNCENCPYRNVAEVCKTCAQDEKSRETTPRAKYPRIEYVSPSFDLARKQ